MYNYSSLLFNLEVFNRRSKTARTLQNCLLFVIRFYWESELSTFFKAMCWLDTVLRCLLYRDKVPSSQTRQS
jgi:hypothetical protein